MGRVEGKVALISGAARGQGRAKVVVVVRAAEAGRVGDDDAHRRRLPAATMPVNHTPKCG